MMHTEPLIKRTGLIKLLALSLVFFVSCKRSETGNDADQLTFNKDIRPILNNKCLACHGGVKKSGQLSFITRDEALAVLKSGKKGIVPGHPDQSELIARIKSHDPEYRMPLKEEPLSKEEIKLLEKWIKQGAEWEEHWAFIPPKKSPIEDQNAWEINAIDHFVLKKLHTQGLEPSETTDKETLIRRVSLDLIGLPPSLEEIEEFVNDNEEGNYERLVDRLLASPRFGERWAAMWMDLARYADSKGYEKDGFRVMWRYRDWLIDAFNKNMPFDDFTRKQLAGDLLKGDDPEDLIATAFHRNTMNNDEGGTIDEEYRIAAVIDRVNTTWDIWQGTTFSCVQCHSHPYDPFEIEEYYQFMAFFNNTEDADLPSEVPVMAVFTKEEEQIREQLLAQIDSLNRKSAPKSLLQDRKKELSMIKPSRLPIMRELQGDERRTTHVFLRGNRLDHGEEVTSGVPVLLPSLKVESEASRLDMADWLVDERNPLTARVTVNRFWAQLFGKGIVETEEDFGSQGASPSNQELLDWLAVHFQKDLKYDIKALLKYMVLSNTYRQSSEINDIQIAKDPYNTYLSRGSRVRLTAEQYRDQCLHVSGLLSDKMHGKSVMPYQPDGVWQTVYSGEKWLLSEGEDAYRRALYTFWRRTSPYPSMISFDAPSREVCVIRRIDTNTPIQALVSLNDPVYLEAANAFANWMNAQEGDLEQKISMGYKKALAKDVSQEVLDQLTDLHYQASRALEVEKPSRTTEKELDSTLTEQQIKEKKMQNISLEDPMAYVANAIMNLNEFLTKQ